MASHTRNYYRLNLARGSTCHPDFKQRVNEGTSTRTPTNRIPDVLFTHEARARVIKTKTRKKNNCYAHSRLFPEWFKASSPCLINRILFNLENREYKKTNTNKKLSAKKQVQVQCFPKWLSAACYAFDCDSPDVTAGAPFGSTRFVSTASSVW
jgi:hypothetical protein